MNRIKPTKYVKKRIILDQEILNVLDGKEMKSTELHKILLDLQRKGELSIKIPINTLRFASYLHKFAKKSNSIKIESIKPIKSSHSNIGNYRGYIVHPITKKSTKTKNKGELINMKENESTIEFEKLYEAYVQAKFGVTIAVGVSKKAEFININMAILRGKYFTAKGKPSMSVVLTPRMINELIKELNNVLEIFKKQIKPKEDDFLEEEWETSEEI